MEKTVIENWYCLECKKLIENAYDEFATDPYHRFNIHSTFGTEQEICGRVVPILELIHHSDSRKNPDKHLFRTMTEQEVLSLQYGQHIPMIDRYNHVITVKVNGKVRTWKRNKDRIEVPLKYGLYVYTTLNKVQALTLLLVAISNNVEM